jgi:hypothetical protein
LFRAIEREDWEGVRRFLTTGKWSTSLFFQGGSNQEHLKNPGPDLQVRTWVTSYDRSDVPEWSQLPLHAAISYSAPFVIVQKLVELYPRSVQCTDNEGMLPIHLAYGFGASDAVLEFLLERFPGAVHERGLGGRLPHECCELGPNKSRGRAYRIVLDEMEKRVRSDCDEEWRRYVQVACQSQGLDRDAHGASLVADAAKAPLNDFVIRLLLENEELRNRKKPAAGRPGSPSSRRGATANRPSSPPRTRTESRPRKGFFLQLGQPKKRTTLATI